MSTKTFLDRLRFERHRTFPLSHWGEGWGEGEFRTSKFSPSPILSPKGRGIKLLFLILFLFATSCKQALWPWSELWDKHDDNSSSTTPAIEATTTYSIALGGVAPGRDELILTDDSGNLLDLSGKTLNFTSNNSVIGFLPRPSYSDFASGSGAQIVPQKVGTAVVTYSINDAVQEDTFKVIVPPQSLIQMMVAEAGGQLTTEVQLDGDSHVRLDSSSPTANGLGSVTKNRITLIDEDLDYSLFNVSQYEWALNPPGTKYDAVITASKSGVYQYSPVDPSDPTHEVYINAESRGFLDKSLYRAYDQAVLSAAHIFNGDTTDPTKGAFAFFSPTEEEWEKIKLAFDNRMIELPYGSGMTDEDFPRFAPIQMLILPGVTTYDDGRPAFVFISQRTQLDYAVTKTP